MFFDIVCFVIVKQINSGQMEIIYIKIGNYLDNFIYMNKNFNYLLDYYQDLVIVLVFYN